MTTRISSYPRHKAFCTAFLILSVFGFAWGEPDAPPVPRLASAPDTSTWTIQYQYLQTDPYPKTSNPIDAQIYEKMRKAYPRLETVQVTKAANKRKEVDQYADKSESTNWIVGDILLTDTRVYHAVNITNSKLSGINYKNDFYNLDWINKAAYKGRQKFQGIDCYVYGADAADGSGAQTAYVDAQTNLPFVIQNAQATLTYTFQSSSETVELPPDMARHLEDFQRP